MCCFAWKRESQLDWNCWFAHCFKIQLIPDKPMRIYSGGLGVGGVRDKAEKVALR